MTAADVLDFWFGRPATTEQEILEKVRRWFMGGETREADVLARSGDAVALAVAGGLTEWEADARGRLALVILLDQLTRYVYRDDPRAYAGDRRAQALALDAFDRGMDAELSYVEAMFLSVPLLHSEDVAMHDKLDAIAERLSARVPAEHAPMARLNREQAAKYREIIARFGRFPLRNAWLGRASTADEGAFLVDFAAQAAPRGVRRDGDG